MQAERGQSQLDNLVQFPNILTDEIDLSDFMDEEISHRIKPADAFREEMIKLILGEDESQKATHFPWNFLSGKFEMRDHEMTVWVGYKGHGKSALISQVLVAAMKRQQRMFIISPEFRPARVLERMLYQYAGTRLVTTDDISEFLAWASKFVWLYDNQTSLKPRDVIALCRYAAKEIEVRHVLIDSLMKCGMGPEDYAGQKNFVDQVQSICHKYPLHLHLVAHARKGNNDESPAKLHDVKGTSEIADMAENVVSVWRNKPKEKNKDGKENEPDCTLTVEAQRNAEGWIGTLPLLYDTETMLFYEFGHAPERSSHVRF